LSFGARVRALRTQLNGKQEARFSVHQPVLPPQRSAFSGVLPTGRSIQSATAQAGRRIDGNASPDTGQASGKSHGVLAI